MRDGVRKLMPGKLSAIAKWELPMTVTALCSFLGFCNYYSDFIRGFAMMAANLLDKLKVGRTEGKKGSKVKLVWNDAEREQILRQLRRLCQEICPCK